MAQKPKNFRHFKKDENGQCWTRVEEGSNMMSMAESFTQQKYIAKHAPTYLRGYDHKLDMKNDAFLHKCEEEGLMKKLDVLVNEGRSARVYKPSMAWYMVMEGSFTEEEGGGSCVSLAQEEIVHTTIREETFKTHYDTKKQEWVVDAWSRKAAWFYTLADAKKYVQMARDEEGVHFQWPKEIPVFWQPGPFTEEEEEEDWTMTTTMAKWKYHDKWEYQEDNWKA